MKKLWELTETATYTAPKPSGETAVFITPNRVEEIMKNKPDVTIDDLLV